MTTYQNFLHLDDYDEITHSVQTTVGVVSITSAKNAPNSTDIFVKQPAQARAIAEQFAALADDMGTSPYWRVVPMPEDRVDALEAERTDPGTFPGGAS